MRIRYDNTADNPANPESSAETVFAGNRSEDEMGHIWLQLLPKKIRADKYPRLAIQEA